MISDTVQGFKVLPIKFSTESTSSHNIYLKEHSVRNEDESKPSGRTLFLINVPPYSTEQGLKNAFSEVGNIQKILLHDNFGGDAHNGFKIAYVVFKTREGLLHALKLKKLKPLSTPENPLKTGLSKWIEDYNTSILSPHILGEEINMYMKNYDKNEAKSNKKQEFDDDGWTVVTKKGRNPGVSRKESVELKINEKLKEGKKKKELKNFYTFQIRESKMKNIANLRKNYEEAKKKVEAMKTARRFKPY